MRREGKDIEIGNGKNSGPKPVENSSVEFLKSRSFGSRESRS